MGRKLKLYHKASITIFPYLVQVWFATCRIKIKYEAPLSEKQAIYVGWHSILPAFLYLGRTRHMVTMVSQSRDGHLITPVFQKLGFQVVRGSRYKGSVSGLKSMLKMIAKGYNVGLAIDGSRGPARKVQGGALFLAMYTGLPIVGVGIAYSHCLTLPTWDQMEIPLPFCQMGVVFSRPFYLPKKMDEETFEKYRLLIENHLFKLRKMAKELAQN